MPTKRYRGKDWSQSSAVNFKPRLNIIIMFSLKDKNFVCSLINKEGTTGGAKPIGPVRQLRSGLPIFLKNRLVFGYTCMFLINNGSPV